MITGTDLRTESTITLTFSGDDFERLLRITRMDHSIPTVMGASNGQPGFTVTDYVRFLNTLRDKLTVGKG